MKSRNHIFAIVGLSTILGFACSNGDQAALLDGDPTSASFQLRLSSSTGILDNSGNLLAMALQNEDGSYTIDGTGITISSAQASVDKIELELPEGISCEDAGFVAQDGVTCKEEIEIEDDGQEELEAEITIMGPIVFDLFTGQSTPDLANFDLPSGVYHELEIEFDDTEALGGNSLVAEGTFKDNDGGQHPFELALKFDEELEIENENGFQVSEDTINNIILSFNVENWFSGLDMQTCVEDGEWPLSSDVLVIDEDTDGSGSCDAVLDTLEENVKNSMDLENEDNDESDDSDESEDDSL